MLRQPPPPGLRWQAILLTAIALSIGWGVRGNWGHEFGAMIPGALAAMAACLCSGREEWRERFAYFAFFGAIGWSFGGSMSYMQVIAYTHSGQWDSTLYGFACLFLMGFLWGSIGGAATAVPAVLDRERMTQFFPPLIAVFIGWGLQDAAMYVAESIAEDVPAMHWLEPASLSMLEGTMQASLSRQGVADWLANGAPAFVNAGFHCFDVASQVCNKETLPRLDWFDTDWMAAAVAAIMLVIMQIASPRCRGATWFLLLLCAGWWIGFLGCVELLDLRMTPPRGDNWAGMLGMSLTLILLLQVSDMTGMRFGFMMGGIFGGLGFAGANLIKILLLTTDVNTNSHSILEQTFGFIAGIGVALFMGMLSVRQPRPPSEEKIYPWTEHFCVAFVMIAIPYLNIRKNLDAVWLPHKIVPETMHGIATAVWYNGAWLLYAIVIVTIVVAHRKRGLRLLPDSSLGRGQLLFLFFLWVIVIGNATRLAPMSAERLVTEGVIHVGACICTLLILLYPREEDQPRLLQEPKLEERSNRLLIEGAAIAAGFCLMATAVIWGLHGFDTPDQMKERFETTRQPRIRGASYHARFGDYATTTRATEKSAPKQKPKPKEDEKTKAN